MEEAIKQAALQSAGRHFDGEREWRHRLSIQTNPLWHVLPVQELTQEQIEEAIKQAAQGQGKDGQELNINLDMDMGEKAQDGPECVFNLPVPLRSHALCLHCQWFCMHHAPCQAMAIS